MGGLEKGGLENFYEFQRKLKYRVPGQRQPAGDILVVNITYFDSNWAIVPRHPLFLVYYDDDFEIDFIRIRLCKSLPFWAKMMYE